MTDPGDLRDFILLDSGGRGAVFRARSASATIAAGEVAVKVLLPRHGRDRDDVHRFLDDEVACQKAVNHQYVARCMEAYALDHATFSVMEYVKGQALDRLLDAWCDSDGPSEQERVALFRRILEGVAAIHTARHPDDVESAPYGAPPEPVGIIHRDLAPKNIIVSAHGRDDAGIPKVVDFGSARFLRARASRSRNTTGRDGTYSHPYSPPEQVRDGFAGLTLAADVHALGVTWLEILICRAGAPKGSERLQHLSVLIEAARRHELTAAVSNSDTSTYSAVRHYARFIERAVESSPGNRFQSAPAMLEAFTTPESVPPRPLRRLWAAGAVTTLGAALLYGLTLISRARVSGPEVSTTAPTPGAVHPAGGGMRTDSTLAKGRQDSGRSRSPVKSLGPILRAREAGQRAAAHTSAPSVANANRAEADGDGNLRYHVVPNLVEACDGQTVVRVSGNWGATTEARYAPMLFCDDGYVVLPIRSMRTTRSLLFSSRVYCAILRVDTSFSGKSARPLVADTLIFSIGEGDLPPVRILSAPGSTAAKICASPAAAGSLPEAQ